MGLFWPAESSRMAKGTSTACMAFQGCYQSSEVPDLQALIIEEFIRGAKLPQKIVLQLKGSLQRDVSVFIYPAVLLEQDPAVKIFPHLWFFFLARCLLAGMGVTLPCWGVPEGQPCGWESPGLAGKAPARCWNWLVGGARVLVVMESGRRRESATVNTSNLTENKRCRIVSLITRIYHRLLAELAKLALCLLPSIWSKLLAVRFLNPARRRNFGSVSGQTPRGPRGGRGI